MDTTSSISMFEDHKGWTHKSASIGVLLQPWKISLPLQIQKLLRKSTLRTVDRIYMSLQVEQINWDGIYMENHQGRDKWLVLL